MASCNILKLQDSGLDGDLESEPTEGSCSCSRYGRDVGHSQPSFGGPLGDASASRRTFAIVASGAARGTGAAATTLGPCIQKMKSRASTSRTARPGGAARRGPAHSTDDDRERGEATRSGMTEPDFARPAWARTLA
jgi:hypothetical protein